MPYVENASDDRADASQRVKTLISPLENYALGTVLKQWPADLSYGEILDAICNTDDLDDIGVELEDKFDHLTGSAITASIERAHEDGGYLLKSGDVNAVSASEQDKVTALNLKHSDDAFVASVLYEKWSLEDREAGECGERGIEIEREVFDRDDLVALAKWYGFTQTSAPSPATNPHIWFSTSEPDFLESGVEKHYALHIHTIHGRELEPADFQRVANMIGVQFDCPMKLDSGREAPFDLMNYCRNAALGEFLADCDVDHNDYDVILASLRGEDDGKFLDEKRVYHAEEYERFSYDEITNKIESYVRSLKGSIEFAAAKMYAADIDFIQSVNKLCAAIDEGGDPQVIADRHASVKKELALINHIGSTSESGDLTP